MNTQPKESNRGPQIILVCLLFFLICAAFNGQRINLVLSTPSRGWPSIILTAYLVLFPLTQLVASYPVGKLCDSVTTWTMFVCAAILATAGTIALALGNGLHNIIAVAILINLSSLTATVAGQYAIGELSTPKTRLKNFNLFSLMGAMANGAASLSVGVVRDYFGAQFGNAPIALTCIVCIAVLFLFGKSLHIKTVKTLGNSSEKGKISWKTATKSRLFTHRLISAIFGGGVLFGAIASFVFFAPIFSTSIGLSDTAAGLLIAAYSAGSILSRLFFMRSTGKLDEDSTLVVSFVVAAFAIFTFLIASQLLLLVFSAAIFGAAVGSAMPITTSICHDEAPKGYSGVIFGALGATRKTFEILVLFAPILLLYGRPTAPFVLSSALLCLAGLGALWARKSGIAAENHTRS